MDQSLEKILNLQYENEIEINLVNAQKYLTKLKSYQKQNSDTSFEYKNGKQITVLSPNYTLFDVSNLAKIYNSENFIKNVNENANKIKNDRITSRNISYDITRIKNSVHKKNSQCGIDDVLSSIDFLNAELSNWKTIEKNIKKNITYYELAFDLKLAFDKAISDSTNGNTPLIPQMTTSSYSENEVKEKIKTINEAINKLEIKRDQLNINITIKVLISEYTKNVLGV